MRNKLSFLVKVFQNASSSFPHSYSEISFTKNPEKYLKFTPEALEEMLETFFDGGA